VTINGPFFKVIAHSTMFADEYDYVLTVTAVETVNGQVRTGAIKLRLTTVSGIKATFGSNYPVK
jgi:hypothetical protein